MLCFCFFTVPVLFVLPSRSAKSSPSPKRCIILPKKAFSLRCLLSLPPLFRFSSFPLALLLSPALLSHCRQIEPRQFSTFTSTCHIHDAFRYKRRGTLDEVKSVSAPVFILLKRKIHLILLDFRTALICVYVYVYICVYARVFCHLASQLLLSAHTSYAGLLSALSHASVSLTVEDICVLRYDLRSVQCAHCTLHFAAQCFRTTCTRYEYPTATLYVSFCVATYRALSFL